MNGKASHIEDAIQKNAISAIDDTKLNDILDELISANSKIIEQQGERSIGPLMGLAMKNLRGKADGQRINSLLESKIKSRLDSKPKGN
jgi:glutamyl-tRNA(Gln) amidotransferase subunit E